MISGRSSVVDLSIKSGNLVIRPILEPEIELADLLAKVTDDNVQGEVDFGPPVGKEIW